MSAGRLLHIVGSPRGARSRSSAVAQRLIEKLDATTVETLDVAAMDLPAFDGAVIEGRYALIEGRAVSADVTDAWRAIAQTIEHFLSFDTYVFSVPMWNFGLPWRLKQYVDVITQPGLAFTVDANGVIGLATGRRAILVCSGALDIRPDQPSASLDFQTSYLKAWLGFIGITDVHDVQIKPTYGSPHEVEAAMAQAYVDADALAECLSRAARV